MSIVTAVAPVTFLELEVTGQCQLACTHCYEERAGWPSRKHDRGRLGVGHHGGSGPGRGGRAVHRRGTDAVSRAGPPDQVCAAERVARRCLFEPRTRHTRTVGAVRVARRFPRYSEDGDLRTAWMLHPDGSWARASAVGSEAPVVHQSGAWRLWDLLDDVREMWLREGSLPVYGASATITPDGSIHLQRGRWRASLNHEETD